MHKAGESVSSWSFGSAHEWFHMLIALAPFIALAFVCGALGALVCRRYPRLDVLVVILASLLSYLVLVSRDAELWSWHPIMLINEAWLFGVFFVAPALLGLRLGGRLYSRYCAKGI